MALYNLSTETFENKVLVTKEKQRAYRLTVKGTDGELIPMGTILVRDFNDGKYRKALNSDFSDNFTGAQALFAIVTSPIKIKEGETEIITGNVMFRGEVHRKAVIYPTPTNIEKMDFALSLVGLYVIGR